MEEKTEHSAGGVVYKQEGQNILWLISLHSGYHQWVLPKGLIESGESSQEAATREVLEETAVKAKVVDKQPIHIETYTYKATFKPSSDQSTRRVAIYQEAGGADTLVHKTVDFYLMQYLSGDPKGHDWEMSDAGWFTYEEALEKLAFPGEKLALQKAHDTISKTKAI